VSWFPQRLKVTVLLLPYTVSVLTARSKDVLLDVTVDKSPHRWTNFTGANEGAAADSIFCSFSDPVRLFWYQDFRGATVQIQAFIWGA
jgi:hypothetical protein